MKIPLIRATLLCAVLAAMPSRLPAQSAPPAASTALGPKLVFITNTYDFGRIVGGQAVQHVFIFSNAGDQDLHIIRVTPGCHCTTAGEPTRMVKPGQTGEIPLRFDSTSFRGPISRTITVASDDKQAPMQTLFLRGTIWRPIETSPQFAYISVPADAVSNVSTVVRIVNQADEPVTLSDPTSANQSFKAELKTITPGKEFELTVYAVPPLPPGSTPGSITIKTSLTNMPTLNITTIAIVQPSISISPQTINLPMQVSGGMTNFVNIAAMGTKPLALTGVEASDSQIGVTMKELNPGRLFQLIVVFPPGYHMAPGSRAHLTIKSNNPQKPEIVIPILQNLRVPVNYQGQARPKVISQYPPPPPAAAHP
jgi:hypothetical protein